MSCVKITMIVVNVFLMVVGLAIGISLIVIYYQKPEMFSIEEDVEKDIKALNNATMMAEMDRKVPGINFEYVLGGQIVLYKLNRQVGNKKVVLAMASFGFFLFFVCALAVLGAATGSLCLLITYIVLVTLTIIACIAIGSVALVGHGVMAENYTEKVANRSTEFGSNFLKLTVLYYPTYTIGIGDGIRKNVNDTQATFSCCGCYNHSLLTSECYEDQKDERFSDMVCHENIHNDYDVWKIYVNRKFTPKPWDTLFGKYATPPESCKDHEKVGCCDKVPKESYDAQMALWLGAGIAAFVAVGIQILAIIFACVMAHSLFRPSG